MKTWYRAAVGASAAAALCGCLIAGGKTFGPSEEKAPVGPADAQSSPRTASAAAGTARPGGSGKPAVAWNRDRIDQRSLPLDGRMGTRATGEGVTVYVIDTGLDLGHAEFGNRASAGADFVGPKDGGDCSDGEGIGHGTFVSGIIAGSKVGIAPKARLVRVQALGCEEGGEGGEGQPDPALTEDRVVRAVAWVTAHAKRPAVVNMSLNFPHRVPRLDAAVKKMIASGLPTVVSAGNEVTDACGRSPAGAPGAVVVGASTRKDRVWNDGAFSGSGKGPCLDLYAPGEDITSVYAGGGTGTSMATATSWAAPHVSGVIALYLSKHPRATSAQVHDWVGAQATKGVLEGVPARTADKLLYTGGL